MSGRFIRSVKALAADPWLASFGNVASGEALTGVFRFIALLWVARVLGPSTFGTIGVGLAVAGYLVVFHSGLEPVGIRRVADGSEEPRSVVEMVLGTRLAIGAVIYGIALPVILVVPGSASARAVVLIYSLSLFTLAVDLRWLFVAVERTRLVAVATGLSGAVYLSGVLLFVGDADDILMVPIIHVVAEIVLATIVIVGGRRRFGAFRPRISGIPRRRLIAGSAPLSGSKVARAFILGFDVVLLSLVGDAHDVGQYAAARRFAMVGIIFLGLYYTAFLPRFVRVQGESVTEAGVLLRVAIKRAALVLVVVGVIGTLIGPYLITILLGDAYREAGSIFAVLVWSVVLIGLTGPFQQVLIALGRERALLVATMVAAAANGLLNLWLVPSRGPSGAATAAVATEAIRLAVVFFLVWPFMSGHWRAVGGSRNNPAP